MVIGKLNHSVNKPPRLVLYSKTIIFMKYVLIDLTRYQDKCGFGEIANNVGEHLKGGIIDDIHFTVLVLEKYKGVLGDAVDYVTVEHLDKDLKALGHKIDLWHTTDQLFIKRRHAKGMINLLTVHDLNFLFEKKGIHRLKRLLKLKWFVKRSDCITVISEYVKRDLLKHVNLGKKPLRVIYNGIQDTTKEEQKRPNFVNIDDKFFFTIGQTRKKKNFHTLIPMMKYFPKYKLFICGKKCTSYLKELLEIKEYCHADNVIIAGEITNEERNWMYAHSEAFLFPSRLEGFGLPVLEAMRYNCKVFSSRYTSLPEICKNHATYFDSFEPEEMANTINEGLANWDRNGELSLAAKEYSMSYNYDKYMKQYLTLYKELLHLK